MALGPHSAEVKRLRRLVAKRAERDRAGVCVVEGVRAVTAALESGADVVAVYVVPSGQSQDALGVLVERARRFGAHIRLLDDRALERVSATVTPQPVIGTVRIPSHRIQDSDLSLAVVLAGVSDPGNAGTIVRVAEAAGASAVIFGAGSVDAFSPKVVRASAGAVFQVPVVQDGTTAEVLDELRQRGVRRLGTAAHGGVPYDEVDWAQPSAVVLGNEAVGIADDVRGSVDEWVTIPMAGRVESLNVAMAASVLLFEAARHRHRGSRS